MSSKAFLLQECENVKQLLDKTLQFEYGPEGSSAFYAECATRLGYITSELQATDERNAPALTRHCWELNVLAELICRIERSSLGEYSWPFVDELKKIATAICTEATLAGANTPPKVFVLADGGLDKYAIYVEQNRPSVSKVRLLTIVFPKSLKHFVLYHSILGHEVGHAIYRCSKHQASLDSGVIAPLILKGSLLAQEADIADRVFSGSAPQDLKDYLQLLARSGITVDKASLFDWANRDAWIEEILCDLIGLTTFGPSFVGAQCELLYGLDPSGVEFGDEHPPVGWRVNLILKGAKILGYDKLPAAAHALHKPLKDYWAYLESFNKTDSWFDVVPDGLLKSALSALQTLLAAHAPAGYVPSSDDELWGFVRKLQLRIPPVGFSMNDQGEPECKSVDFRHILYAGWIASRQPGALSFDRINRLCEHAIMQQRAIDVIKEPP